MNFVNFVKNATILTVIVVLALQSMSIERMRSRIVALERNNADLLRILESHTAAIESHTESFNSVSHSLEMLAKMTRGITDSFNSVSRSIEMLSKTSLRVDPRPARRVQPLTPVSARLQLTAAPE
jgi:replicative DNA helicase